MFHVSWTAVLDIDWCHKLLYMVQCEFTEADFVGFTVRGSSYEIGKERVKGVVEFVIRRHGPEYSVRTEV
jgi:hypothetical protein